MLIGSLRVSRRISDITIFMSSENGEQMGTYENGLLKLQLNGTMLFGLLAAFLVVLIYIAISHEGVNSSENHSDNDNKSCSGSQYVSSCFSDVCYQLLDKKLNWMDARNKCTMIGSHGDLLSIFSEQESEFVARFLCLANIIEDAWTSGTCDVIGDSSNSSNCMWLLTNPKPLYMSWEAAFEKGPVGDGQKAIMLASDSGFLKWKLVDVLGDVGPVICKWKLADTGTCPSYETFNDPMICPGPSSVNPPYNYSTPTSLFPSSTTVCGDEDRPCSKSSTIPSSIEPSTQTSPSYSTNRTSTVPSETTTLGAECPETEASGCSWPRTPAGKEVVVSCPKSCTGEAVWFCNETTLSYDPPNFPDLSNCSHKWIDDIFHLISGNMSATNISEILLDNVSTTKELYSGDLLQIQTIIMMLVQKFLIEEPGESHSEEATNITNSLLSTNSLLLEPSQIQNWYGLKKMRSAVATKLTKNVQDVGFIYASAFDGVGNFVGDRLALNIERRPKAYFKDNAYSMYITNSSLPYWNGASLSLPRGFSDLVNGTSVSVVTIMYTNIELFLENNIILDDVVSVISNVLSVSFGDIHATEIIFNEGGFEFQLPLIQNDSQHVHICAFWNSSGQDDSSLDSSGCDVVTQTDTMTSCHCNHLTNFAILLDINNIIDQMPEANLELLESLSLVTSSFSVLCLVLCIYIFQIIKTNASVRICITRNLCICLLLQHILMLTVFQKTKNKVICAAIAVAIEYTILSSFAWMFLEGVHLYQLMVFVFEMSSRKLHWYYITGYGGPVIIITASVFIWPHDYGTDKYCWLNMHSNVKWTFVVPVAVVIVINSVVLIMALRAASNLKMQTTRNRLQQFRKSVIGAASLMSILGITWIFGYFYMGESTVFFAYIFTALSASQGIFIFVFHCIVNVSVRRSILEHIRGSSFASTQRKYREDTPVSNMRSPYSIRNDNAVTSNPWSVSSSSASSYKRQGNTY